MKKTLIALLALGGLAVGEESITLENAVLVVDTPISSIDLASTGITNGTFTISAQLDLNFLANTTVGKDFVSNSSFFSVTDKTNTGWHIGTAIGTSTSNNVITKAGLYCTSKAADTFYADTAGWMSVGQNDSLTADMVTGLKGAALTMTYDASTFTASVYMTLDYIDPSRETVTISGSNNGFKWSGQTLSTLGTLELNTSSVDKVYVFSGAVTANQAWALNNKLVPEPTTATLSLLALAGLAARRRRK